MTASLDSFRKLAEPNLAHNCDALLSTFVCRQHCVGGSPEWVSISTRIMLIPPGLVIPSPAGERIFESGRFRAAKGIVTSGRLSALLDGFEHGRLLPDGLPEGWTEPIVLTAGPQSGNRLLDEPRFFDSSFPPKHLPWQVSGYGVTEHYVTGSEDPGFWAAFDRMQRELTAWDPPYPGMAGLARDLLLPTVPARNIVRLAEVLSPFWVQLVEVAPARDRRTIRIVVRSDWNPVPPQVTLSVIPHGSDFRGRRMSLTESGWATAVQQGALILKCDLPVGEGPISVCLNFGNESIATCITGLGSSRVMSHLIADPEANWLKSCLTGKDSQTADLFEAAVTWLLHLLGFASVRYGYKRLQRSVDVQAFLDDAHVVFAECSVELPDSAKLQDVKHRAKSLEAVAAQPGRVVRVLPTIFTSASSANSERASDPDVVVFTKEELGELLERALRGDSAHDVFEEIEQRRDRQVEIATMTS
jgi:hypothetical protein